MTIKGCSLRDRCSYNRHRRHCNSPTHTSGGDLMNSVVHFEMPYDDPDRMAKFYRAAFGWETRQLGETMGDYVLATTTESDESGPRRPGAINGGFFPKQADRPMQFPSVVIAVDDIQDAIDRVTRAGGNVLGEPMAIPGIGRYV